MRTPLIIASAVTVLHLVLNALGQYGYFRDELYYIVSTEHLDWGFIDHPPLSILLLLVNRTLFGDSLFALRLLPALLNGVVVFLTAVLARDLGGDRTAQTFAALAAATAPVMLALSGFYSMNVWDVFFWVVILILLARVLSHEQKWNWIALGIAVGLGLQNKYSVGFLCVGVFVGLLLTPQRRLLLRPSLWLAAGIAAILFAPHITWQIAHGFPSLEFMHNARFHKNLPVPPTEFLAGLLLDQGPANPLIWVPGFLLLLFSREHSRYRVFGIMVLVVLAIFMSQNGKTYYVNPAFPVLFAAGGIAIERWTSRWRWVRSALAVLMCVSVLIALPLSLPVLSPDSFLDYPRAIGFTAPQMERGQEPPLPQHFADQFGWKEKAEAVARAYRQLTPEEQRECVIYADNYGRAAAVEFFGKELGLPPVVCSHNSYWMWGFGQASGKVIIILGGNQADHERGFEDVQVTEEIICDRCMPYENHLKVYICRGLKTSMHDLWPRLKVFI